MLTLLLLVLFLSLITLEVVSVVIGVITVCRDIQQAAQDLGPILMGGEIQEIGSPESNS